VRASLDYWLRVPRTDDIAEWRRLSESARKLDQLDHIFSNLRINQKIERVSFKNTLTEFVFVVVRV
jgi:hypothetical protein